jgi:phytoene synthase
MTGAMNVLSRYGRTFSLAGKLLPAETLAHTAELYAFCRAVDDLADETSDPDAARRDLSALRTAILTHDSSHPLAGRLLALHESRGVSLSATITLIDTVSQDLGPVRIVDESGLLSYAYGAAGTVGLMMCAILDVTDERAVPYAIDLGIAMQLTNIARDVAADAAGGRIYLPAIWLPPGTEPDSLTSIPPAVFAAVRRVLDIADRRYRNAERGYDHLPSRVRPGIRAAGRIYEEIGRRILRRGPDYLLAGRYAVAMPRKLMLMAGCLIPHARAGTTTPALPLAIRGVPGARA